VIHGNVKLGKKAPRHDMRTLRLSSFTADIPFVPPRRVDWSLAVNHWPMFKNDTIGCCTVATAAHLIHAWTANAGSPVVLSDDDVIKAYSDITGYDGTPETDNGAVVLDVLNYWRKFGIGGHKIDGYVALNPQNRRHMDLGVYLFGGVYLGVGLPISAQDQEVWSVPDAGPFGDGKPGSWGGHAYPIFNENPTGYVGTTWGALKTASRQWAATYYEEAFACLSGDWVTRAKASPGLIDYEALQSALAALK
jgi:hypothetical protein